MGRLEVYQKDQKHSKYVEVRAAVKKEYRQAGGRVKGHQAAHLGSRMTRDSKHRTIRALKQGKILSGKEQSSRNESNSVWLKGGQRVSG